jgi:glycosyltransferase involved in cell wall biosynthesis
MMKDRPRRILVIQNRFRIGGQEQQSLLHLRTLDRTRWEPIVACLRAEGEHLAEVRRLGFQVDEIGVGDRLVRPSTLWHVYRLARRIRAEGIALVHAHDFYGNVLGVMAARIAGVPSVATRVDLAHAIGHRWPLLRAASLGATRVLVNALAIRDLCIRDGVDASRVVVVRNGVDLAELDRVAATTPGEPAPDLSRPTVILVGNMHHRVKGQADLLVAMRQVLRSAPEVQLVLVGDGVLRPALERQAAQLGIAAQCRFLGHRRDVSALLARSRCAVSASYAEGISNAVLEAMAARLPVVGTAVGGTPEMIKDGVQGFLVPPGAPAVLAERIADVLRDPAMGARMGQAGRATVEREFGLDQMRLAYDALYEELAGERQRVPAQAIAAGAS